MSTATLITFSRDELLGLLMSVIRRRGMTPESVRQLLGDQER